LQSWAVTSTFWAWPNRRRKKEEREAEPRRLRDWRVAGTKRKMNVNHEKDRRLFD
jgi:hypothetical protein